MIVSLCLDALGNHWSCRWSEWLCNGHHWSPETKHSCHPRQSVVLSQIFHTVLCKICQVSFVTIFFVNFCFLLDFVTKIHLTNYGLWYIYYLFLSFLILSDFKCLVLHLMSVTSVEFLCFVFCWFFLNCKWQRKILHLLNRKFTMNKMCYLFCAHLYLCLSTSELFIFSISSCHAFLCKELLLEFPLWRKTFYTLSLLMLFQLMSFFFLAAPSFQSLSTLCSNANQGVQLLLNRLVNAVTSLKKK